MRTVDFKFGTLIQTGLKLIKGGQWDADLVDWRRDSTTDAFFDSLCSPISSDSASQQSSARFYYSHFKGQGRDMLADALGADDPFRMLPYEILERVLANGAPPQADSWQANLWRDIGQVYEIRLARRNFLVAISRGTEEINVQEICADAYPSLECGRTIRRPSRRPRSASPKTKTSRNPAFPAAMQAAF